MPLPSSPLKNATPLDAFARLLEDGVVLVDPLPEMIAAAERLAAHGLVAVECGQCVRCADPADGDFAWSDRTCPGEIVVDDEQDEVRCPVCGRVVFVHTDAKRRHRHVQVHVRPDGVMAYLRTILTEELGEPMGVAPGVLSIAGGYLCMVDLCGEAKYIGRDWARTQPTLYVTINPRLAGRFLDEDWICRLQLADIVAGEEDLVARLRGLLDAGPPALLQNASLPVCATAIPPIIETGIPRSPADRCFIVQLALGRVLIDGVEVIGAHADTRLHVFRVFWRQFLDDLREGRPPEQFRALSLPAILSEMAEHVGRQFVDEMTIRRSINRLQTDFVAVLRRTAGLPVLREDIIETCRWNGQGGGQYGYRLNPLRVAVRSGFEQGDDKKSAGSRVQVG